MTQEQCDNCGCVSILQSGKSCKKVAEMVYKDDPDAICEDFERKEVV